MTKRRHFLAMAALAMLAMAIVTTGSNRGFLIHIPLIYGYDNVVSLPYNTQYANANAIFADIPNCSYISRWNPITGSAQDYCGGRGPNYTPGPGEALQIAVTQSTTWVVVGTHNNAAQVQLYKIPEWAGDYPYDWNWIAPPYHTKAQTASDLFQEIPNCLRVSRYNNAQSTFERWDGTNQSPDNQNFIITPGEGYTVKVSADCTWTPSHY
jgi:hypothetical protein